LDKPTIDNAIEIEDDADAMTTWKLSQCPREYSREIVESVNAAQLAETHLPVAGGTLDQSAWWIELWLAFKSNVNRIEYERAEREKRRGRR
jgi:hypothetical protein